MNLAWYHPTLDKIYKEKYSDCAINLGYPLNVCFQLSNLCNFNCSFCISNSSPNGDIDDSWVELSLTRLSEINSKARIVWSGGEPTLVKKLPSYIKLASELGFINVMTTNGSKVVEINELDWVDISIYGNTNKSYIYNTKKPMSDRVWKNIEEYVRLYDGKVSVSILLDIVSLEENILIAERASKLGVNKIRFQRPITTINSTFSDEAHINEQIREIGVKLERLQGLSLPNSKSENTKKSGYFFVSKGGVISNSFETVSLFDKGVKDFLNKTHSDHLEMFITDV